MNMVAQFDNYKIYRVANCFILHNSSLDFSQGHTHLDTYKQCLYLINLSKHHRIPHHISSYLLTSLIRINRGEYQEKVQELLDVKKSKTKQHYYNQRRAVWSALTPSTYIKNKKDVKKLHLFFIFLNIWKVFYHI